MSAGRSSAPHFIDVDQHYSRYYRGNYDAPSYDGYVLPEAPRSTDNLGTFPEDQPTRVCSIRGCTTVLPPTFTKKMCDTCRERHKGYASTKRAKRKQEKEAVLMQSLGQLPAQKPPGEQAWSDEHNGPNNGRQLDSASPPAPGPSKTALKRVQQDTPAPEPSTSASPTSWNHTVLDPRLFASNSSELAGALTLPLATNGYHGESSAAHPETGIGDAQNSASQNGTVDPNETIERPPEDATDSADLPPRFCSVKGCKAIITGNYLYKMCQSCRDRYRGYGVTKRAKWRQERIAANAEIDRHREEEDKRRAEEGLPPLAEASTEEWNAWASKFVEKFQPPESDSDSGIPPVPRICSVSHCHKLLPGHYRYRRCEEHRIQNRHHSHLKRVREKAEKAEGPPGVQEWVDEKQKKRKEKDRVSEPLFTRTPIELDRQAGEGSAGEDEGQADGAVVVPPAARGMRRANNSCSMKGCFNLLSPDSPWKMCDACRERDRQIRQARRIRDLHLNAEGSGEPSSSGAAGEHAQGEDNGGPLFSPNDDSAMNELSYPGETPGASGSNTFIREDPGAGNESSSATTRTPINLSARATASAAVRDMLRRFPKKPTPKKTRPKKAAGKAKETADETAGGTAAGSASAQPAAPPLYPPPYPYPYYMPPPFYGMQPPGSNPPSSAQPGQGQQPAHFPPYPPYPPYGPYGPYPPPPGTGQDAAAGANGQPQMPYPPYPYPYPPPPVPGQPADAAGAAPTSFPYPWPPHPYPPPNGAATPVVGGAPGQPPHFPPYPPYPYIRPFTSVQPSVQTQAQAQAAPKSQPKAPRPPRPNKEPVHHGFVFQTETGIPGDGPPRKRRRAVFPPPNASASSALQSTTSAPATAPPAPAVAHVAPPTTSISAPVAPSAPPQDADASSTSGREVAAALDPHPPANRVCSNKSCHRSIPQDTSGTVCDRCRVKMKKHVAKSKQRYRLEPRKHISSV